MNYEKITKWLLVGLLIGGLVLSVYGFFVGWPGKEDIADESLHFPVDLILWGAYIFAGLTVLTVAIGVLVLGGISNPKSLIKLGIGLVVIAAVVGVAYMLAPGSDPVGYLGEPVDSATLKMTDTILNLTYLLVGGTFVALIAGWIIGLIRK